MERNSQTTPNVIYLKPQMLEGIVHHSNVIVSRISTDYDIIKHFRLFLKCTAWQDLDYGGMLQLNVHNRYWILKTKYHVSKELLKSGICKGCDCLVMTVWWYDSIGKS